MKTKQIGISTVLVSFNFVEKVALVKDLLINIKRVVSLLRVYTFFCHYSESAYRYISDKPGFKSVMRVGNCTA